jgi:phosphoadenosine phosphosulfate reductase
MPLQELDAKPDDGPAGVPSRAEAATALLRRTVQARPPVALASSFSIEDMVLVDLIRRGALDVEVFMLDTGRLHEETHALVAAVRRRYGISVKVYFPDAAALEPFIAAHGPNAFYDSIEARQRCCAIRKVEPLRRALAGRGAWITGQRRQQSATRRALPVEEWDAAHGLHKLNPLAEWTAAEVRDYIAAHDVPYNPLHDQGYASIGCAPCTRAITPGEDIRAGRWWWEDADSRECGLHPNARRGEQERRHA